MGTSGASFFQFLWESLVQTLGSLVTKRAFKSHIDISRLVWEPTVSHIRHVVLCTRSACNSKSLRVPLIWLLYFDVNPAVFFFLARKELECLFIQDGGGVSLIFATKEKRRRLWRLRNAAAGQFLDTFNHSSYLMIGLFFS